jgi:hypothetical protein
MQLRGNKRLLGGLAAWVALAVSAPAMASAASISGTVTTEGGQPIQGVQVCGIAEPEAYEDVCSETDSAGNYQLLELFGTDYRIRFSAEPNNLKYVSEWYDNATHYTDVDVFHLGAGGNATVNAALAEGGSIAGIVTDEVTHQPIAGIRACATDSRWWQQRCSLSGADGGYLLNGLPSDTYSVDYAGGNRVNYLREFYEDAETWAQATAVVVTVPALTAGIDAELAAGAEVLGRVTDPVTGAPSEGVYVCALEVAPGEDGACDATDAGGDYAIRGIPGGSYLIAFEPETYQTGVFAKQWWEGASSAAEADPIVLTPPETRTGIDGQATSPLWFPPLQNPNTGGGAVTLPPLVAPQPQPRGKCRKGFHRKWVKGKRRCVRKHRRHHHRHRKQSADRG